MYFKNLFMNYGINCGFYKKIPNLVNLIATIVFNDSFRLKN